MIPTVRAALAERFIFNFRLPLQMLASYLPVPWLTPQEVQGYGVASFCILDLRGITVAPLTTTVGLDSISCAPRYAVLDASAVPASPAVFVTERQTNSRFGAWFTTLGFSAPHPRVDAVIDHHSDRTLLRVHSPEDGLLLAATVHPAAAPNSDLFASAREFADFIAQGVSSYGRSRHGSRLTKVDLHKEDASYTPLATSDLSGVFAEDWQRQGGVFDSAFHTSGGRYEWTYQGMTP
ncbi:MAG TPA: hypothetical protein VF742_17000 [Terracidiphilus sp.]